MNCDYQDINELITTTSGRAFGGDSDESDVEKIDFNPVGYFLDLMVHEMRNEKYLPGDSPKVNQVNVTQEAEWYPFKNEDVCAIC